MYHHLETTKKPFIGKTLNAITRVAENIALVEFGDETKLQINVNGDCCSHSIFYELEMPDALIGATLEDIIEDSYNEKSEAVTTADDEETALAKVKASGMDFSPECNSVWNVVLKTNRGNALLRHINSSNGYYDGMTGYEVVS